MAHILRIANYLRRDASRIGVGAADFESIRRLKFSKRAIDAPKSRLKNAKANLRFITPPSLGVVCPGRLAIAWDWSGDILKRDRDISPLRRRS